MILIVSRQTEWRRESGQSGGGHGLAASSVHNQARGSAIGASFKTDLSASHLHEKFILAFGKHFKLRPGDGLPVDRDDLGEEAVAIASDFENAIAQLIPPRVAIEERRINRNLGVRLWRIEIGKRRLRVQEMNTDVIDPGRSESIGQRNYSDTRFRIVSDE